MSRPYAFPRGKGAPTAAEMFRLKQQGKRSGAIIAPATQAVVTPPSQPTFVPPSAPPTVGLTVDDPLSLSGTELSLPAAGGSGGYIVMVGDLSGSGTAPVVAKIQGVPIDLTGIDTNDLLSYNGTTIVPTDPSSTGTVYRAVIKSADYTILTTDTRIDVDTSGGNVNINLPPASTWPGHILVIGKTKAANQVVINPNSTDTLNEVNSNKNIISQYVALALTVRDDNTGWFINSWGAV